MILISAASCLLALIPALLFLRNLALYRRLPSVGGNHARCSVLLPARNEEANIVAALQSVLASTQLDLEVIVLDDGSIDRTAELVQGVADEDPRVRLQIGEPLPSGWCGKNFACHQLAARATHPFLVFMDVDVRISKPDSLLRLTNFMAASDAALVSGVPREETGGLTEKLVIPLIHFVLLGFLPLQRMRSGTDPRFAAACGQILAIRRDTYESMGGHAAIRNDLHDAVALARRCRAKGFKTDLFDATDSFRCRMYQRGSEVWSGFAKNAYEGLGSPRLIVPATLVLFGGQVAPLPLLLMTHSRFAVIGTIAAFLPRLISVIRFRQSLVGALLHPIGVCALIAIQWFAFFRAQMRYPAAWKGRSYSQAYET